MAKKKFEPNHTVEGPFVDLKGDYKAEPGTWGGHRLRLLEEGTYGENNYRVSLQFVKIDRRYGVKNMIAEEVAEAVDEKEKVEDGKVSGKKASKSKKKEDIKPHIKPASCVQVIASILLEGAEGGLSYDEGYRIMEEMERDFKSPERVSELLGSLELPSELEQTVAKELTPFVHEAAAVIWYGKKIMLLRDGNKLFIPIIEVDSATNKEGTLSHTFSEMTGLLIDNLSFNRDVKDETLRKVFHDATARLYYTSVGKAFNNSGEDGAFAFLTPEELATDERVTPETRALVKRVLGKSICTVPALAAAS